MNENHDYRDFSTPRPREAPGGSRYFFFFFWLDEIFQKRKSIKWDIRGKRCQIVNACTGSEQKIWLVVVPKRCLTLFFLIFDFSFGRTKRQITRVLFQHVTEIEEAGMSSQMELIKGNAVSSNGIRKKRSRKEGRF